MKIIEFFGLPYSGKSYYANYCKKFFRGKIKIYDKKLIFFKYLLINKKINIIDYFIFLLRHSSKKTKNYKIQIAVEKKLLKKKNIKRNKFFYKKFFFINKEKYKLFRSSKKKYFDFYKYCLNKIRLENSYKRRKKLYRWLIDELNAYYLAKSYKIPGLMIVSESFIQRFHSYYLNQDQLDKTALNGYLNFMPYSDFIFFVKTDTEILKSRLQLNVSEKKEKFYLNNFEKLEKKMDIVYDYVIKKKNVHLIFKEDTLKKIISSKSFDFND